MATGSAAGRAGPCSPSCSSPSGRRPRSRSPPCCSRRPTTRCARCAGASPRYGGGSAPARCWTVTRSQLTLPAGTWVDVDVLVHGHWSDARRSPGPRADLLDGVAIAHADAVRGLAAVPAPAPGGGRGVHPSRGRPGAPGARRARTGARPRRPGDRDEPAGREPPGAADPLYRLAGDDDAAARQFDAWSATAERELGTPPGAAVLLALRERPATVQAADPRRSRRSPRAARPPCPPAPSRPGSRRSRPRSGWPTVRAPTACGSRPGWSWRRR